jgi:hypothetical protein
MWASAPFEVHAVLVHAMQLGRAIETVPGHPRVRGDSLEARRGRYSFRGLLNSVGRRFSPNPESEAVRTTISLSASPESVWKALRFYEEVPDRPGLLLFILLPRPIRSEGEKTRVGASVRCVYDGGHIVKRVTVAEPDRLLRFEVLEQDLGIEHCVSMGEGSYEIRSAAGGSEVCLTTHYRGHLRPRALARPFERMLAHRVHRHILEGMRAALGAPAPERAIGDALGTDTQAISSALES